MIEWKPVPGYESFYAVSSDGQVARTGYSSFTPQQFRRPLGLRALTGPRYLGLLLHKDDKQRWFNVHVLVALAFLGPRPTGYHINHKNGIKTDNRLENLEYVTPEENRIHYQQVLGTVTGSQVHNAKLTKEIVRDIRVRIRDGAVFEDIAVELGLHPKTVKDAATGRNWSHVSEPPVVIPPRTKGWRRRMAWAAENNAKERDK